MAVTAPAVTYNKELGTGALNMSRYAVEAYACIGSVSLAVFYSNLIRTLICVFTRKSA